jgi:fatty acid synthase
MEASLSKLGMDSLMGVEILQVLERDFDLVLSSQELRSLTLNQLEKLVASNAGGSGSMEKSTFNIENLLTSFGDEKTSSEIILKLNNSDLNDKKILIIPGFEGMASSVWFEFADKLEVPSFALQLASTVGDESLDEIFEKIKDVSLC